jgi:hypothetical protein
MMRRRRRSENSSKGSMTSEQREMRTRNAQLEAAIRYIGGRGTPHMIFPDDLELAAASSLDSRNRSHGV